MTGKQAAESDYLPQLLPEVQNTLVCLQFNFKAPTPGNLFLASYTDCAWSKTLISVQALG